MKLKRVGFYKELRGTKAEGESIREAISEYANEFEEKIIEYLNNGLVLIGSPGPVKDVLNDSKNFVGSMHILTDGLWAWPSVLKYYVKEYHIKLPEEFINHMLERNWIIKKDEVDISTLEY